MNQFTGKTWLFWLIISLGLFTLAGCADRAYQDGMKAIKKGDQVAGVALLEKAAKNNPSDHRIRIDWLTQRDKILQAYNEQGNQAVAAARWDEADTLYQRALEIDASNDIAQAGLATVNRGRSHSDLLKQARLNIEQNKLEAAQEQLSQLLSENPNHSGAKALMRQIEDKKANKQLISPSLNTLYDKPITLELRDANLKMALEGLSRTTNINFVLDKDVRPDASANLFVKDASLEQVINMMLATNQLHKKLLNEKTVLIYPNRPDKIREYQELAIKSFYLTNADVRKTMEVIRTFVKTRDLYVDERLNLIILRDTPDAIRVAERLVALLDLPEPEVMLEVEVLEIQSSRLHDLGVRFPQLVTLNVLGASSTSGTTTASPLTLNMLNDIPASRIGVSGLSASISLKRELGTGNILANPRIRARNREKAKIKIGDRVPVISTTQMIGAGASNVTSDAIQYLDVGLSVEVEPNIYLDDELAIKLALEVSSVVREVRGSGGSLAYQIGTRNVNTVLRLKNGETQVLGGLIRDEERDTVNKLPGLGDLPILGRLFSGQLNQKSKTEIILSITPHLVRNIQRPSSGQSQFWTGTEANLSDGRSGDKMAPASGSEVGQEGFGESPAAFEPFRQMPNFVPPPATP